MRRSYQPTVDPRDATIERLERELDDARMSIIGLMPQEIRRELSGYYSVETRSDGYRWEGEVVDRIIEAAKVLPRESGSYFGDRAYCPLCGGGTSSPYESGFSVPEGLRRHLIGWGSRHNQCAVFSAAAALARNYWHRKLHASEVAAEIEKADKLKERELSELRYLVDPLETPYLIDTSIGYGSVARDPADFTWAENRLGELGFKMSTVDRVKTYTDE